MQPDGLFGLELRHLVALEAIASEGSFGRAAQRLGYTQSAISQQIASLERIVGQRLIERPGGPRPVTLTEAGALLLSHAEGIMARLQAASADLEALAAGDAGPLRIGTYQSVGARILPRLLSSFSAEWPKVDIRLVESTDDRELLQLVECGEADVSFCVYPLEPGPFEARRADARPVRPRRRQPLAARGTRQAADAARDPRAAADQLPLLPHDAARRGAAEARRQGAERRLPLRRQRNRAGARRRRHGRGARSAADGRSRRTTRSPSSTSASACLRA